MARHYSFWRLTSATLCILVALAWNTEFARGQTTYNFVNPTNAAFVDWDDSANWNPTGFPNAPGDAAIFTRPTVSPSASFSILLPFDQDTTVGSIFIDSTGQTEGHGFEIDGGQLIFQTTSGSAAFTTTADGGSPNGDRVTVWNDISVLSDLVVTLEHKSNLNSSSFINSLFTGASDRTITKEGLANMEMSSHGFSGFGGQYVINNGAIRFLGDSNFSQSTGITVNSGGQLQFNSNASAATYNWELADGAVLKLNGTGKSGGSAPGGALRFQGQAGQGATHATLFSPVELQTDSEIAAGPATVTGELAGVVSGSGGLIKSAPGILILSNAGNSYAGDTTIVQGTLSLTNPFLSDLADVFLATGTTLNLNYSDTDVIDSLFINGESQSEGLWGATGNVSADFQTDLITGLGLLQVSTFVAPGLAGDYNDNGTVDAADYVTWRKNNGTGNALPNDNDLGTPVSSAHYDLWVTNFGSTSGGGSGGELAAIPEPSAAMLAVFALCGLLAAAKRR